jgi:hypothetical protein
MPIIIKAAFGHDSELATSILRNIPRLRELFCISQEGLRYMDLNELVL